MAIVSLLISPVATVIAERQPDVLAPSGSAVSMRDVGDGATAFWAGLSIVGAIAGAWHGTKRNGSVLWGVVWGAAGGAFPIVVPTIAIAQGFGKKVRS